VATWSKVWVCGYSPAEIVGMNLPGSMDVCLCECCVLSGRSLCVGLITLLEDSYQQWCVIVCDPETLGMRRLWPTGGHFGGVETEKFEPTH
jgi:hypothetical protein